MDAITVASIARQAADVLAHVTYPATGPRDMSEVERDFLRQASALVALVHSCPELGALAASTHCQTAIDLVILQARLQDRYFEGSGQENEEGLRRVTTAIRAVREDLEDHANR